MAKLEERIQIYEGRRQEKTEIGVVGICAEGIRSSESRI